MKKLNVVFAGLLATLIGTSTVSASKCNYSELSKLNQEAAEVKLNYEIKTETITDTLPDDSDFGNSSQIEVDYFKVSVVNLTDNLYVKITNPNDNSTKLLYGKDAVDGVAAFDIKNTSSIANLTYKVYTSSNTSCPDEEIVTDHLTLPKYNEYYLIGACAELTSLPECQKYVTEDVTAEDYQKVVQKRNKKVSSEKLKDSDGDNGFFSKNKKGFIIGGSIIIVLGVVTATVVIKKRRSRLI
ncbi:MAG: hypothetical protein K6G37_00150 [Bacilli bacterium]|nr:hypothetical protein [Bacilli bacterium]